MPAGSDPEQDQEDAGSRPDPTAIPEGSHPDRDPIAEGSQGKTITKTREGVTRAPAREDTPTVDLVGPTKPRRRGRKPSEETAWPDDLVFGESDRGYAEKHGFAGAAGERLFEKFEAKAKAKGWTNKDWHAAFRNFVLNEHPPPARPNGAQPWRAPDV